jgi:HNH endonuclease
MTERKPRPAAVQCVCGDHFWRELGQGYVAMVSPEDESVLQDTSWRIQRHPTCKVIYARSQLRYKKVRTLHREVLGASPGQMVDHINHNGLDNRRSNIRFCTPSGNMANRRLHTNNTSGLKGVSYSRSSRKWTAMIAVNGHQRCLGLFESVEEAARVYDAAAIQAFGQFALTNAAMGLLGNLGESSSDASVSSRVRRRKANPTDGASLLVGRSVQELGQSHRAFGGLAHERGR